MKLRTRFALLFSALALALALVSTAFALRAIGLEYAEAESELGSPAGLAGRGLAAARDRGRAEGERLEAALAALDAVRAASAAGRVLRSQAALEAAASIGVFCAASAGAAALLFALAARPLSRRLDELAAGARRAAADRSFRFPALPGGEFAPVYGSFNAMLELIAAQEAALAEAARLEGWKEVSSFLFHQLRGPLASLELAAANVSLAAERAGEGRLGPEAALGLAAASAGRAAVESRRMRGLLDRFKSLAGLSLGPAEPVSPRALAEACAARLPPGRVELGFSGAEDEVLADPKLLEEALMNLVQNAVEAAPALPATVRIGARRRGGRLELEIEDGNGPVDPALFERLGKERFSTKSEGTGLGLLFVRRVAALHGGSLELGPGREGGFSATLSLPAALAEASARPSAGPAAAAVAGQPERGPASEERGAGS